MHLTLHDLNVCPPERFCDLLAKCLEGADWIGTRLSATRPFASLPSLQSALVECLRNADPAQQRDLLARHAVSPRLFGADNHQLAERLGPLLAQYESRFGFPFVLAPHAPSGQPWPAKELLATLERRLRHPVTYEFAEALRQVHRCAELRLHALLGHRPAYGEQVIEWAAQLARYSEPAFAQQGQLTVSYLSRAHLACAQQLVEWMRHDCGFDEVDIDAVGNVVGVYHGSDPEAPRLLTGSHYDTVPNAGRYDGRLGILVPMICVRALQQRSRRLPFGIEVVAFAEEEGQRFPATFLASRALTGRFDPAWLDQTDAHGITLRAAMTEAGLALADIPALARDPARYLGFVEVHIEQGPVLTERDLPLGVVTGIYGSLRYRGEVIGLASHAGTTPMGQRLDAAAAVAELVLYVEQRAAAQPGMVGTVGELEVPHGAINVVPGRCRFTLDLRAGSNAARDALAADVRAELARLCARRGLTFTLQPTAQADAAPSDSRWQARWAQAVAALGLPVFELPSGAGHDAMTLGTIMPQAMLFVRGQNGGISHNPLEAVTDADADLAVQAMRGLLAHLAAGH